MERISHEDVEKLLESDTDAYLRIRDNIKKRLPLFGSPGFNPADTEDIVQTVISRFIQALRGKQEVRDPDQFLESIALNTAQEYLRKIKSQDNSLIAYDRYPKEISSGLGRAIDADDADWFSVGALYSPYRPASFQYVTVEDGPTLTPRFLSEVLAPYLDAIALIQNIYDDVRQVRKHEVVVRVITQLSPIDVSLTGAADAISAVKEDLIPWRKEHAKQIAALQEKQIEAEIKKKNAEALEIRSRSHKEKAEAKRIEAEAAKLKAEAEKMCLENEKLKFELESAKLKLALELVAKMKPDLLEPDRIAYAVRLLPAINVIATSDIEIAKLLP